MKILILEDKYGSMELLQQMIFKKNEAINIFSFDDEVSFNKNIDSREQYICFIEVGNSLVHRFLLAKKIHEINPKTKVIYIANDVKYAMDAFDYEADGYLLNPICEKKVNKVLEIFLKKKLSNTIN